MKTPVLLLGAFALAGTVALAQDAPKETKKPADVFKELDKNSDGKISREEFAGSDELFKDFDKDKSGFIEPREWGIEEPRRAAGGEREGARPEARKPNPTAWIDYVMGSDRNRDGKLTTEEITNSGLFKSLVVLADGDKDGALTKEELTAFHTRQAERMKKSFDAMDTDKDGKLSLAENTMPVLVFAGADLDRDGALTFDEYQSAGTPQAPARGGQDRQQVTEEERAKRIKDTVKQTMERFDKNGDGKISGDEIPERGRQFFERMDTDGDGAVSEAELEKGFSGMNRGGERRGGDRNREGGDRERNRDRDTEKEKEKEKEKESER